LRAVIFANGVLENAQRAQEAAENADLILAANGGALHCLRLDITPALVVGDLDSLDDANRQTLEASGTEFITHPPDKDQTDLELAMLAAVNRRVTVITVLGAMGGRLDMAFANVLLLALPELSEVRIELWQGNQTAWLVRPPGEALPGEHGDLLSLIPLGGAASGVTTVDLKYALSDETLKSGPARGISNVIDGSDPSINLRGGAVLVVHTPKPASIEDQGKSKGSI
jgi:thiamine pyrophosphokinase